MSNIMLIMYREAIVQGLMDRLKNNPKLEMIYEPNYDNANLAIRSGKSKIALIEATESGHYDMAYCIELCKKLRRESPECKLLLMCCEQDTNCVKQVVDAKGKKVIDDFVFYDATIDYLASKLISILK